MTILINNHPSGWWKGCGATGPGKDSSVGDIGSGHLYGLFSPFIPNRHNIAIKLYFLFLCNPRSTMQICVLHEPCKRHVFLKHVILQFMWKCFDYSIYSAYAYYISNVLLTSIVFSWPIFGLVTHHWKLDLGQHKMAMVCCQAALRHSLIQSWIHEIRRYTSQCLSSVVDVELYHHAICGLFTETVWRSCRLNV